MLGKRFRRTTSMTQLGPPCPSPVPADGNRVADAVGTVVPYIAVTSLQVADPMATEQDPPPSSGGFPHHQPIVSEHVHHHPPPPPPPFVVPHQMGLWTGYQDNTFLHVTKTEMMMSGYGKLAEHQYHGKPAEHQYPGVTISPVGFLDMCFFCKRRLRHERDIFIYRGDTAFCSEECRHRQILSDERRAATSNQRKGATNSSETAVAA